MDKDRYEDFRNAMGLDKSEVFHGLVDSFLWAETPLSINGEECDPEDQSFSDYATKVLKGTLVLDTAAETTFSNAAYAFVDECILMLLDPAIYKDSYKVGIDLWLTIAGHGTGFWDGDYGDIGERLTEIARRCMDPWTAGYITEDYIVTLDR